MAETLSPFVYWAQTETHLSLKIDLKNVSAPEVLLNEDELEFTATGYGAKGRNIYHFVLEFYSAVDPKASQYKVNDRQIDFSIKKQCSDWWPRIISDNQKPAWLKLDFDKWKTDDEDIENEAFEKKDILQDYKGFYNKFQDEEVEVEKRSVEDFRKVYLFLYNLFQFIGFSYIVTVMTIRYSQTGPDSMEGTYEAVGRPMRFVVLMQILESIHPMLGYTIGSFVQPAIQVLGRITILFLMIDGEPRMQSKPVVFYLFLVWSTIELVRYPYYMLKVYNKTIGFLTWLRYTIWIPLYPLGFLCEGVVILRNIPYFEETRKFSISLPNKLNFSIDFPSLMRIYLLFLCFPVMYCMMSHMYQQRVKRIGPKSWHNKET